MSEKDIKSGTNRFVIRGKVVLDENTFKLNNQKEGSSYIYNLMNLNIDCGKNGVIRTKMQGGYSTNGQRIFVHGVKKEENRIVDDWENRFEIDWEDRFNFNKIQEVGRSCFVKVALEKDENNVLKRKNFLSPFDAINYIKEKVVNGMFVEVKGKLKFDVNMSNPNNPYISKEIQSISLSSTNKSETSCVELTTVINDKNIVDFTPDENGFINVNSYVSSYVGKIGNVQVKKNLCLPFNFCIDTKKTTAYSKIINKFFSVYPNKLAELSVLLEVKQGNENVTETVNVAEYSDDIKELIELGIMSEEDAKAEVVKGVPNQNSFDRYVFTRPLLNNEGNIMFSQAKYDENDLSTVNDYILDNEETEEKENNTTKKEEKDSIDTLKELGIDLDDTENFFNLDEEELNIDDNDLPF